MSCFQDASSTFWLQMFHQRRCHFFGDPLLVLELPATSIKDASQFGDTDNTAFWNVGNMTLTDEREHVVFTHGGELDVLQQDHLITV